MLPEDVPKNVLFIRKFLECPYMSEFVRSSGSAASASSGMQACPDHTQAKLSCSKQSMKLRTHAEPGIILRNKWA